MKIKKGGSMTEIIINNLFMLVTYFISIAVILYFMKKGLFSAWDTAKEYGATAQKKTVETA